MEKETRELTQLEIFNIKANAKSLQIFIVTTLTTFISALFGIYLITVLALFFGMIRLIIHLIWISITKRKLLKGKI